MRVDIIPAGLAHTRELARTMRAADRAEIEGFGLSVRYTLHRLFRDSTVCKVALVEGGVAAVWGVQGQMLACVAHPWLFTAPLVERIPVTFYRVASLELRQMLEWWPVLTTRVAADYKRSIRLWQTIGFQIGPIVHSGRYAPYRDMSMRKADFVRAAE